MTSRRLAPNCAGARRPRARWAAARDDWLDAEAPPLSCVIDRVGVSVRRFGSFWRLQVRCGASGLSCSYARRERSTAACEFEGAGGASATATAVSPG